MIPSESAPAVASSIYSEITNALPTEAQPTSTAVPELPEAPEEDPAQPGKPGKGWTLKKIIAWLTKLLAKLKNKEGNRNHARDLKAVM